MADRLVTHVERRGRPGRWAVSQVAFPGAAWSPRHVHDVVRDIAAGRHRYVVPWQGGETEILVVKEPGQEPYLRTEADDAGANNLESLPDNPQIDPGERTSVTTWSRIESRVRSTEPGPGLAAALYDPLWLLARQWQLGEFEPSDGGSPVSVHLQARHTALDRFGAGLEPATTRPYDSAVEPLESLVEREPGPAEGADLRTAVEAGLHFLRALRASGAGHLAPRYLAHYGLSEGEGDGPLKIVAGRVPDGRRLRADLDPAVRPTDGSPPGLPDEPAVTDEDDRTAAMLAARAWLGWSDTVFPAPDGEDTWRSERMEHAFSVGAPAPHTPARLVLDAREHHGGHLDRDAFDAHLEQGPAEGAVVEVDETTLPTPVSFPGMPAPRWWEFEDTRVDLGAVDAAREDLAQMVLLEFALVYGNDWFIVPLQLPVGSVSRVTSLVVTDSFGHQTQVRSVREHDPQWRLFSLEGLAPEDDVLLLPPTLAASLEGPPLEDLLLLRDPAANLCWAVEKLVQGPMLHPIDREEQYAATHSGDGRTVPRAAGTDLAYRLVQAVPDYWIPLVPTRVDGRAVALRRGLLLGAEGGPGSPPRGRLLRPDRALTLYEEEVPREGARVTRRDEYARWLDGSTLVWRARRKVIGRGEAASALAFDALEAPESQDPAG